MSTSSLPAKCAKQDFPGADFAFAESVGLISLPARTRQLTLTWYADALTARQDAVRRATPTWRRTETAWQRAAGGDHGTGLHLRGDRS